MLNKKKISLLIVSLFLTLGATISSAVAWYVGNNVVLDQTNLGGSLLKGYFHCGDGTSSTYTYDSETGEVLHGPFTITTPMHYENLVKLHYNVEGFSEKEYHFAFGYPLLGSSDPVFYSTNNGVVDDTKTSTILDLGGMTLPPLGTSDNPFFGHIEGNGLSISNFTVTGQDSEGDGYCDIGIFGYVSSQTEDDDTTLATINNCYWSNFTIDTTGGDSEPSTFKHDSGSVHEHSDKIHMGYLAGHVVYGASFTDCYVNDCHLKGGTNTDTGLNNYGYFGKVEIDALGGKTGKGNDYEFTLNSQACYNYFNSNYTSIQNDYLVTRNTREADTSSKSFEDENGNTVFETDKPFSTAVTKDSNSRYVINDGYSLSKTGFTEPEFTEETHNFNAYYDANHYTSYGEDGNETTISLGDGINKAVPNIAPIDAGRSLKDENNGLIQRDDGNWYPSEYYYKDGNTNDWYYGISYNRNIDPTIDYVDTFTINVTMSTFTSQTLRKPTISLLRGTLYVDDYDPIHLTIQTSTSGSIFNYKTSFTVTPVTFSHFQYGKHFISVFVELEYSGVFEYDANFYYGSLQNVGGNYTLYQNQELINHEGQISKEISFDTSSSHTSNVPTVYDQKPYDSDVGLVDERTREYPIYFYEYTIDEDTGNKTESSSYCTDNEILSQLTNLDLVFTNHSWYISKTFRIQVQGGDNVNYFVADRPQLVDSGYSYKNIDITGGCEIYYRQIPILGNVSIISLPSERSAGTTVGLPSAKGNHFYAEEACQGCVVLFIKNTVNAADNRDEDLGHIVFTYVEINFGNWGLELVDPVFKKGNAFMDLEDSGDLNSATNPDNLTKQIDVNLKESDVQKVSYCCLDENGNILGKYDTNGNTEMTSKEIAQIDTYVLAIGGYSTSNSDAWVTNVDFSYKAEEGYGGTFGSVGYRSSPDTLETTILNIYFASPANSVYELYVNFDKSTLTYTITFTSNVELSANVFNYQSDTYTVKFNDETHTQSFFSASSVSP